MIGYLYSLTVDRGSPAMRGVLWSGRHAMAESEKSLGNVFGHRNVNMTGGVIPVNFETEVAGTGPINCQCVFCGKGRKKVIGISLGEIFNTKVINSKGEGCVAQKVSPKARCVSHRDIAKWGKVLVNGVAHKRV